MKPERKTKRSSRSVIGVEIGDRPRRDAGLHRGLGDGRRDAQDQPRIERARDQRARAEALRLAAVEAARDHVGRRLARELRDGVDRGELHLLVDGGGADIERAAEDEGKAQDVVDLVRDSRSGRCRSSRRAAPCAPPPA